MPQTLLRPAGVLPARPLGLRPASWWTWFPKISMNTIQLHACDVVVRLKNGLHLAPAVQIVRTAQQFHAEFAIHKGDRCVDGKSMLDLMTLAAEHGA
ncbi:MAG: HPr family phosphocarrier protein, partial [Planctomycetaceae bacterium]